MTREENIFLAKKLYAELVFNTAYIEGVNITFPQTQTILDGGIVNDVAVSDIQTVLNLRDGWRFILNNVDTPVTVDFICKVNEYVSRNESLQWGVLRTGAVGISGTDFKPKPPINGEVKETIELINKTADPVQRATDYFCYAVHSQLFWDGNKRTSTMIASKMLIESGAGVLTIDKKNAFDFNAGLLHLYNTGERDKLKRVLAKCIRNDLVLRVNETHEKPSVLKTLREMEAKKAAEEKSAPKPQKNKPER